LKLENKVAVITGGTRGIGKGIAEEFLKEGARVAICGISEEKLKETLSELSSKFGRCIGSLVDVRIETQISKFVKEVLEKYERIDILVNNAAVAIPKNVVDFSNEDWSLTIDTNLTGTFLFTREVLPHMIKNSYGRIINISSCLGKNSTAGLAAYSASKFGVIGLSLSLAKEVRSYGINVNVICPDRVDTKMARGTVSNEDFSKWLQPCDIAKAALFLANDEDSNNITGSTIDVYANFGNPIFK